MKGIHQVSIASNIKLTRNFQTGEFVIQSEKGLIVHRDFKMLCFVLEKIGQYKVRLNVIIDDKTRFDCEIEMGYEINIEKIMALYETFEKLVILNKD